VALSENPVVLTRRNQDHPRQHRRGKGTPSLTSNAGGGLRRRLLAALVSRLARLDTRGIPPALLGRALVERRQVLKR
jgi:hypothetical protein